MPTQADDEEISSEYSELEKIFIELRNQTRLEILKQLSNQNKCRLSSLSKDLDLPKAEVHRNITRLEEARLIKRETEGFISLTTFEDAIMKQISSIKFLSRYREYFTKHTCGTLPDRFIRDLAALEKSIFVDSISGVLEVWKKMIEGTDQFLYGLIAQLGAYTSELAFSRAKDKGIRIKIILPIDANVAKRYFDLESKYRINESIAKGIFDRRVAEKVDVILVVNEKQACVSFPDATGLTDFNSTFYGDDSAFYNWCIDYFQYSWNSAMPYNSSKFRIIQ